MGPEMAATDFVTQGELKRVLITQTRMILSLAEAVSAIQATLLENGSLQQSDLDTCLQGIRDSKETAALYKRLLESLDFESFESLLRRFQGNIQ